jgi:GNAT superfamily N-acetyltransferase
VVATGTAVNFTYDLRRVTPADFDLVCRHRHEMFKSSGRADEMLAPMTTAFRSWLPAKLSSGEYFGWILERDGIPAAGLGMMVLEWPPHPAHPEQAERGYILNVFVEPEHRGRGLAKQLMVEARDEARHRNLTYLVLHTTAAGRPLYEGLGWTPTTEMALKM